ncbi:MAG: carbohydrate kinase family protein [Alkalibacterium sp.]|uniref:carbohydrate kinase family protein n=2 Tax=Alkalibacterium TaxID=99906 RepID=UPI000B850AB2|nr:carbohydrate kinase family protein [Alkalibacterium gilvum]MDN6193927.1 carbohydrate kinase family protein [Alkalibacterium sp.]MDN6294168.1 carbohydrate kinase family protein [Alkalibacterium sp.]MDN6326791.1 carbohydrate kinase family protein [Alkalibacterium sp.]MDN6398527.1 carbohydrate kinase family protein [Alkalibacterium sp.]MDN6729858.1 carbohydrate kinase family protein [Alkalibacterium sp.]
MSEDYVVVVGGLNIDIAGLSGPLYREKDSNIGEVSLDVGGVGQNISHNLTKLEVPTHLISVYGDDHFGEIAKDKCKQNGIKLNYSKQIKDSHHSIYLYVNDNEGDLVTAINDMEIIENITPKFLEKRLDFMNKAKIVVIDCNIPQTSIEWLADHLTVPIFIDPVSVAKVSRIENILDKIDTLKPNEHETELLTGIKVFNEDSARDAAKALNKMGVKNVFISLGSKGILCSRNQEVHIVRPYAKTIISTNGTGDCTMATIVWARFSYGDALPLEEIGALTQAAASITLESRSAVSPDLSIRNVVHRAQENI